MGIEYAHGKNQKVYNQMKNNILQENMIRFGTKNLSNSINESNIPTEINGGILANWMSNNEDLLDGYTFKSSEDGPEKTVNQIRNFISRSMVSQWYLNQLIDDMDKLPGVAIDKSDFYDKPRPSDSGQTNNDMNPRDIFPGISLD